MSNSNINLVTTLLNLTQQGKIRWNQETTQTNFKAIIDDVIIMIDYRRIVNLFRIVVFDKTSKNRFTINVDMNDINQNPDMKRITNLLYMKIREKFDDSNDTLNLLIEKLKTK